MPAWLLLRFARFGSRWRFAGAAGVVLCLAANHALADPPVFDRDVLPILSDKCFLCHGPDETSREADLRLDRREVALESGAIVEGHPEESEVIARITSTDPDVVMPPLSKSQPLSAQQIETLRAWIADGAPYAEHWSFRDLPAEADVPKNAADHWSRGEIDRFVLARLQAERLEPASEAEPLRLLRRVSLALTGLPPTPEQIAAFETSIKDHGVDAAYAALVEQLLASPAFGEQQSLAWLDAVRYADSYGYQSDQLAVQWPYRDWVVRALNANLPFDEFLTWQLAGDLLPKPTRDQLLATMFSRLNRLTAEGGSIPEEWLVENAADRLHTFGSALLGLTLECARCHDHKYDPLLQRDYYSLMGFFNSIDESGLYENAAKTPTPSLLLPTAEQQAEVGQLRELIDRQETMVHERAEPSEPEFERWLTIVKDDEVSQAARSALVTELTFDEPLEKLRNSAPGGDGKTVEALNCKQGTGHAGKAVELNGDEGISLAGLIAIERHRPFTLEVWIRDAVANPEPVVLVHDSHGTDTGFNGFDVLLAGGVIDVRLYRVWPGNGIGVRAQQVVKKNQWTRVTVTYDGSSRAEGIVLYLDGQRTATETLRDHLHKSINVPQVAHRPAELGARFRDRGFKGGAVDEFRLYNRVLAPLEVAGHSTGNREELRNVWHAAVDPIANKLREELIESRDKLRLAEDAQLEVAIMKELPEPRPTYLLARGAYDAPKTAETRVQRDVFQEILPQWPAGAPRDRLGLAQWVTDPNHPLTARVAVNRVWANFFGRGLVSTPDNFGRQGAGPTHPELLDWLARDFIASGWDYKRLCRQIALSAVYRQSSAATKVLRERDAENLLLARGPSYRLSGEQLRDLALASSALLESQVGGPPVAPYQPGGDLWKESNIMSPPYQQSTGVGLYRRSLYSVWKRTAPLPNMLAFDAPTREVCVLARSRTNTPLQALVLLNDEQFVEAARALAVKVASEQADLAEQIRAAFVRLVGRLPSDVESQILTELYRQQRELFHAQPAEAQKLLEVGESIVKSDAPPHELAALTVVCQAILNLDETITLR